MASTLQPNDAWNVITRGSILLGLSIDFCIIHRSALLFIYSSNKVLLNYLFFDESWYRTVNWYKCCVHHSGLLYTCTCVYPLWRSVFFFRSVSYIDFCHQSMNNCWVMFLLHCLDRCLTYARWHFTWCILILFNHNVISCFIWNWNTHFKFENSGQQVY